MQSSFISIDNRAVSTAKLLDVLASKTCCVNSPAVGIFKFEGLVLENSFKELICVCMYVYVWACAHECSCRSHKRDLELPES